MQTLSSTSTSLANTGDIMGSWLGILIAIFAVALVVLIIALIVMRRRKK